MTCKKNPPPQHDVRSLSEGFRKQVDYEFSTAEINVPVKEILQRAGWREALDSETKGALVMGAMGLSALLLVPLALGIKALVG